VVVALGFAVPLSVAAVVDTAVAASVVTVGGPAVVKLCTAPKPVPSVFDASAQ
jgi:hypothetical protein